MESYIYLVLVIFLTLSGTKDKIDVCERIKHEAIQAVKGEFENEIKGGD